MRFVWFRRGCLPAFTHHQERVSLVSLNYHIYCRTVSVNLFNHFCDNGQFVRVYICRTHALDDADWRCSANLDAAIRGWVTPALQVLTPDTTRNPDEHAHDDHEHTAALECATYAEHAADRLPALILACIATPGYSVDECHCVRVAVFATG